MTPCTWSVYFLWCNRENDNEYDRSMQLRIILNWKFTKEYSAPDRAILELTSYTMQIPVAASLSKTIEHKVWPEQWTCSYSKRFHWQSALEKHTHLKLAFGTEYHPYGGYWKDADSLVRSTIVVVFKTASVASYHSIFFTFNDDCQNGNVNGWHMHFRSIRKIMYITVPGTCTPQTIFTWLVNYIGKHLRIFECCLEKMLQSQTTCKVGLLSLEKNTNFSTTYNLWRLCTILSHKW